MALYKYAYYYYYYYSHIKLMCVRTTFSNAISSDVNKTL